MRDSSSLLLASDFPDIVRYGIETLQLNLGYRCNQSCAHCHVNAGPSRTEAMSRETIDQVLWVLETGKVSAIDITGGAPELHPDFRYLVSGAVRLGLQVNDRCNLTVLFEDGQQDTAAFLAANGVGITASLPCYLEDNVDAQRGRGVYQRSIEALLMLNELGYGRGGGLRLDLVYNPLGATLPPPQQALQEDYKRELRQRFGIEFDHLLVLTNLPVSRFGAVLLSQGRFASYMQLLRTNHCAANLEHLMCRRLISVDWQGWVYDCDFNQMLDLPVTRHGRRLQLRDLLRQGLHDHPIRTGAHCYGCTAGQGSSCSGALKSAAGKSA